METTRLETDQMKMKRLVAAVVEFRDPSAFEALYMHVFPRVRSNIRKMTRDANAADELAQEVMLSVWRKAHQYEADRGQVSTWIFRIARNVYIDSVRRRMPEFDENYLAFVPEEEKPADRLMIKAQDTAALNSALAQLKEEYPVILRLSYFEGMPHSAISTALGIPLGTVTSRIRIACERLRWVLQHATR